MQPSQWWGLVQFIVCSIILIPLSREIIKTHHAPRSLNPFVEMGGTTLVIMDRRPRSQWEHDWEEKLATVMNQLGWSKFAPLTSYVAYNPEQALVMNQDSSAQFLVIMCIDEPAGMAELDLMDRSGRICFSISRAHIDPKMDFQRWVDRLNIFGLQQQIALSDYNLAHSEVAKRNFDAWRAQQE